MKVIRDGGRWVAALEKGEEVISAITDVCAKEGINCAFFQGIGAVEKISIGSYDREKRVYNFVKEDDVFEVASLLGNVTLVDEKPFVHAHAVLSRTDGTNTTIGGHLKEALVAVTLEVVLVSLDVRIVRKMNDQIGLKLIDA